MRVVKAISYGTRLAYFCPDCGELVVVDTTQTKFPTDIAKCHRHRALLTECTNKNSFGSTHIVVWEEE